MNPRQLRLAGFCVHNCVPKHFWRVTSCYITPVSAFVNRRKMQCCFRAILDHETLLSRMLWVRVPFGVLLVFNVLPFFYPMIAGWNPSCLKTGDPATRINVTRDNGVLRSFCVPNCSPILAQYKLLLTSQFLDRLPDNHCPISLGWRFFYWTSAWCK